MNTPIRLIIGFCILAIGGRTMAWWNHTETYRVTAYCPCEICCGEYADGITASGHPAEGFIIAAPPEIPFGTIIPIDGYFDKAVVRDRGGVIKGKRLDLLFPTHKEAMIWGVQYIEVHINRW